MNWLLITSAPSGVAVLTYHPNWDTVRGAIRDAASGVWQLPGGDLVEAPVWWQPAPTLPEPDPERCRHVD